jgi:hypothetical protein
MVFRTFIGQPQIKAKKIVVTFKISNFIFERIIPNELGSSSFERVQEI